MALLEVKDLTIRFRNALKDERNAADHVSFQMEEGEILGLVGESGSGKSVTAMAVAGLLSPQKVTVSGSIRLNEKELLNCSQKERLAQMGKEIGIVFQEPMTSMNPTRRIGPQIEESLRIHTRLSKGERKELAIQALKDVEIVSPEQVYHKYPHELSGGMLQRVMIAAAIIARPKLLLADEPTTALDVTIQKQILDLLIRLNHENGMAILFISHNLHVVRKLCGRVAVMQNGVIIEENRTGQLFEAPRQEYTRRLIAAIPTREKRLV